MKRQFLKFVQSKFKFYVNMLSCHLATFMLPINIVLYFGPPKSKLLNEKLSLIGESNVANGRLFWTITYWLDKSKTLLFDII